MVPYPRPSVDIRRPPEDLDDLIDWFELVNYNLVLLEEYPLEEIRASLETVTQAVEAHLDSASIPPADPRSRADPRADLRSLLLADHEWFRTSLEQLWWFFAVVEREDHGGNRQALGQYGRVLAESLRRHRRDERRFEPGPPAKSALANSDAPPRNSN
jgi:hypothetical protein